MVVQTKRIKNNPSEFRLESLSLKRKILTSLRKQGFVIKNGQLTIPDSPGKDFLRSLHEMAVNKRIDAAEKRLKPYEHELIDCIADGDQVEPTKISPRIVPVLKRSKEELLFRYASLHWSIPVSSGYGRRMRFVVMDQSNNKLMGIIGLGDPVYALKARDNVIQWTSEQKKERLFHVMDAFVLGAIPPYSSLLCGKLMAMLALSNEVRDFFSNKYSDSISLISKKKRKPILALVTTTSAYGRSSMYNRIKINGNRYWIPMGFTSGSGDFHFSNGVYASMSSYVNKYCVPTARNDEWGGNGFRNRREVIKKALTSLDMPAKFINHQVRREIYLAPLGTNTFDFLRGNDESFCPFDLQQDHLFQLFKERWLIPRATQNNSFKTFKADNYKLWG